MILRLLPLLAVAASAAALADEEVQPLPLERARSMRDQAAAIRAEADRRHHHVNRPVEGGHVLHKPQAGDAPVFCIE